MTNTNKEAVRLWVDALRSGKYDQGKNQLRTNDDQFCCLGVACDISPFDWKKNPEGPNPDLWRMGQYDESGVLPEEVRAWLGLDSVSPRVPFEEEDGMINQALYILNDMHDLSFDQIADLIEAEFLS